MSGWPATDDGGAEAGPAGGGVLPIVHADRTTRRMADRREIDFDERSIDIVAVIVTLTADCLYRALDDRGALRDGVRDEATPSERR
jgi:hypothetical protein